MLSKNTRLVLFGALVALVFCPLPLFALLHWPDAVHRAGLGEKLWYVSLVFLGLGTALWLYALTTELVAWYKGKVQGGTLTLAGPVVPALVIIVLGVLLPPKPTSKLDVTVFIKLPIGAAMATAKDAQLTVDLDTDRRTETADDKGAFRLIGVPADLAGKTVNVNLKSLLYELSPGTVLKLATQASYLQLQWKTWTLHGSVVDAQGKPVPDASVILANQKTLTDADGRFKVLVSSQTPENQRFLEVRQAGFSPWRGGIGLGVDSVAVQLTRGP